MPDNLPIAGDVYFLENQATTKQVENQVKLLFFYFAQAFFPLKKALGSAVLTASSEREKKKKMPVSSPLYPHTLLQLPNTTLTKGKVPPGCLLAEPVT